MTKKLYEQRDHMAQEWQPIESAPKDGTRVLLFSPNGDLGIYAGHWNQYTKKNHDDFPWECIPMWCSSFLRASKHKNEFTHWKHLPKPPEEQS